MKHILLFALLTVAAGSSFSQVDFPLETGRWVNRHRSYVLDQNNFPTYTLEWIDVYCGSNNDTLINGMSYKQIDFCTSNNSTYHAGLREDNGAIYMVCKDSVNEYLLYDFNAQAGDTLLVIRQMDSGEFDYGYYLDEVVVESTTTAIYNAISRRVVTIEMGFQWIEGIGCTSGLFMESWINISQYFRDLICMSANDTIQFSYDSNLVGTSGDCPLTLSLDEFELDTDVRIYPNPATADLNLQFATAYSGQLDLVSIHGEILRTYSITNSTDFSMDLEQLAPGSYFVNIPGRSVLKFNKL